MAGAIALSLEELWLINTYFSRLGQFPQGRFELQSLYNTMALDHGYQGARSAIDSLLEKGVLNRSPDGTLVKFTPAGLGAYNSLRNAQRSWGQDAPTAASHGDDEDTKAKGEPMPSSLDIFISHSSADVELASLLVDLLEAALHLRAEQVRCTSVEGHRLEGGADTEEIVRQEVRDAKVLLGLLSPGSLRSTYVAFELGARWGAGKRFTPLLAPGVDPNQLEGPIASRNALKCELTGDLQQLIGELGKALGIAPDPPQAWQKHIQRIQGYAPTTLPPPTGPAAAAKSQQLLRLVTRFRTKWRTECDSDPISMDGARGILAELSSSLSDIHDDLAAEYSEAELEALVGAITETKQQLQELRYMSMDFDTEALWDFGMQLLDRVATFAASLEGT